MSTLHRRQRGWALITFVDHGVCTEILHVIVSTDLSPYDQSLSMCSLGRSFKHSPRSTTFKNQMPVRSSLSRSQLTASCPALDTPCSPADFSVSVPRIATCWGPPGASWSPHFSLPTPKEEKNQRWIFTNTRRAWTDRVIAVTRVQDFHQPDSDMQKYWDRWCVYKSLN